MSHDIERHQPFQHKLHFESAFIRQEAERAVKFTENAQRSGNPSAEAELTAAEHLVDCAADPDLQLRFHRSAGRYYLLRRRYRDARKHFVKAELTARVLSLDGIIAQLQLFIVETSVELNKDATKKIFFANFRNATQNRKPNWSSWRDVWFNFIDDCNAPDGRLAAREFGSVEDFRSRLDRGGLEAR